MKRFLITGIVLLVFCGITNAESIFRSYGHTNYQYENIVSSGINNITWDRKVHEIEIVQISTNTLYVDLFDIRYSSCAEFGNTAGAQSIDRVTGMAGDVYILDSNTARTKTIFSVESDDFSLYVSTDDCVGVTPDIRVIGKGW